VGLIPQATGSYIPLFATVSLADVGTRLVLEVGIPDIRTMDL
jgi:hypothetical protein